MTPVGTPAYDTSLEEWAVGYIGSNFEGEIRSWIDKNSPFTVTFEDDNLKLNGQNGWWKFTLSRSELQARRDSEWYYEHDPRYKAVMDIAMRLCEDYDYNWGEFISKPEYARFASDPRVLHYQETLKLPKPPKYAVCDGYADAVVDEFAVLPFVKEVRKWTAPGHAFNELIFDDDRHLWVDVTWMDNDGNYSHGKFDTENISYDLIVFEAEPSIAGGFSHKEREGFQSTYNPSFYKVRWYVFDVNNNREVTLDQMYAERHWSRSPQFDNHEGEYILGQGYRYEWRSEVTPIKLTGFINTTSDRNK
jgi:hypothetical protein